MHYYRLKNLNIGVQNIHHKDWEIMKLAKDSINRSSMVLLQNGSCSQAAEETDRATGRQTENKLVYGCDNKKISLHISLALFWFKMVSCALLRWPSYAPHGHIREQRRHQPNGRHSRLLAASHPECQLSPTAHYYKLRWRKMIWGKFKTDDWFLYFLS